MQNSNAIPQEKKPQQKSKISLLGAICGYSLIGIALIGGIWGYNQLPKGEYRDMSQPTPWMGEGIEISSIEASWKNSKGNERLQSRTTWYPHAVIKLAPINGKGRIDVIFRADNGSQVGDTVNLFYENGTFKPKDDIIVNTEGNTATCWQESGYATHDAYHLHQLNIQGELWRVEVYNRPDNSGNATCIGVASIPAPLDEEK